MGGTQGKFRKQLQRGEEYAALRLCERRPDLRKKLDPNQTYGEAHQHNTPLHYAAQHSMKALIRLFLTDLGGNPNKKNADEQTSVQLVCQGGTRMSRHLDDKIRSECLALMLTWQGPTPPPPPPPPPPAAPTTGDTQTLASAPTPAEPERAHLDHQDVKKNTALHYATASGLKKCVEMLVSKGANLMLENEAKETACDVAERSGLTDIAELLERKMLFSSVHTLPDNNGDHDEDDINEEDLYPVIERFSGLRETDLIEAKDLLLVETSDMLRVPLFTAEALLRNHEWSREALWVSWNRDPVACCDRSGVLAPSSARDRDEPGCSASCAIDDSDEEDTTATGASDLRSPSSTSVEMLPTSSEVRSTDATTTTPVDSNTITALDAVPTEDLLVTCEVCFDDVQTLDDTVTNGECGHKFCKPCWKQYTTMKIEGGDLHNISCPAFGCSKLVPLELIELVVSPTVARKYFTFDIKAFVDSNPRIKWCPSPGCNNAVALPEDASADEDRPAYLRAFPKLQPPPKASRTVYCPLEHGFCWDCLLDGGHEPIACEKWREWHEKIGSIKPEELKDTGASSESAANCLWLVTHSKPCPKCRSPIQKNEGCNHMKCSKCRHDFCWVCLGQWKKHGTETGGYFRCNRYDDSRKIDEKTEAAIAEAKEQSKKAQELNRFVHYYSRYKNHLNSFGMEKILRDRVGEKMEALAKVAATEVEPTSTPTSEAGGMEATPGDFSFIDDALKELLRSRRVLSSSYAYGYYLKDCGYNKTIFEYLQNELEVSVETLSGLVGRSYLRGSRRQICRATQLVASRRQRFLLCVCRGLVPPETPPALRRAKRRQRLPALLGLDKDDEADWTKSGLPPFDSIDPNRPWVKDSKGRHHNLLAILDWPIMGDGDEDVSDDEVMMARAPSSPVDSVTDVRQSAPTDGDDPGECRRSGCSRRRAKNPRTGDYHDYCSLKCRFWASENTMETEMDGSDEAGIAGSATGVGGSKQRQYNVDLMIALQMSRLQLLQDLKALTNDDSDEDERWSQPSSSASSRERRPNPPRRLHHRRLARHFSAAAVTGGGSSGAAATHPFVGDDMDLDVQLAIERSVTESLASSATSRTTLSSPLSATPKKFATKGLTRDRPQSARAHKGAEVALLLQRIAEKPSRATSTTDEKNMLSTSPNDNASSSGDKCTDKALLPGRRTLKATQATSGGADGETAAATGDAAKTEKQGSK